MRLSVEDSVNGCYTILFVKRDVVISHNTHSTTHHDLNIGDQSWLINYIRNKAILLIPQICDVMMTPRHNFDDVKRELVKL